MKTRNPGWISGGHYAICDVCGFAYRANELLKRWDNAVVCRKDYEPRHPLEFVRAVKDDQAPQGLVRSEPADQFTTVNYINAVIAQSSQSAVVGFAIVGLAVVGNNSMPQTIDNIPTGTYGENP